MNDSPVDARAEKIAADETIAETSDDVDDGNTATIEALQRLLAEYNALSNQETNHHQLLDKLQREEQSLVAALDSDYLSSVSTTTTTEQTTINPESSPLNAGIKPLDPASRLRQQQEQRRQVRKHIEDVLMGDDSSSSSSDDD